MSKRFIFTLFLFITAIFVLIWLKNIQNVDSANIQEGNMKLTSVFTQGEKIPSIYTCDGDNVSPELIISQVPQEAKSLALIVDDPDAPMGLFVHWVLYNIPASTTEISSQKVPQGAIEGMTNFGRVGYGGPCPPNGEHRYFFKLYAIDKMLELPPKATKAQVENAIRDHIIEKTELMGVYKRM